VYGTYHPILATTINSLAALHEHSGQLTEARALFEKALQSRISIYGDTHSAVAGSYNNLALCLKKLGELDEARPLYEKSLAIRKRQYGDRHPAVATALNNLGLLLKKQRKYDEAMPKYKQALQIRQEIYGVNHPDVAASLNNLALLYDAKQQRSEALKLHEEALIIRAKVLGEDHKLVAESYNNIGLLLKKMGQVPRAKEMFEKALAIRMLQGEDHPDVKATQANIAGLVATAETGSNGENVVHLRVFGREHLNLALSLRHIALKLGEEGFVAQSRPMLEQSLALLKESLNETDEEIALGSTYLADVYRSIGKNAVALKLYHDATYILRVVHGSSHISVINSLVAESELLAKQSQFDNAKSILHDCLTIAQQLYGDEHDEVARVLSALACVCKGDGDYYQSKNVHEKALSMLIKLHGDNHPLVAQALSDIGELMQAMGKFSDGIATHTQALHMRIGAYGGDKHRDVALSYLSLGSIYKEQENWTEAKISLEKAIAIFQKLSGSQLDPKHAQALHWLAPVLIMASPSGELDPAVPIFEKALDIRVHRYGRVHEDTAETMHDLAAVLSAYPRTSVHERAVAVLMFEDALRVRKEVYSEEYDHPSMVKTLEELCAILVEERLWSKALDYIEDLLSVRRREFPKEDNIVLGMAYRDAALVVLRCGDLKKAKEHADKALEISLKTEGEETATTADMYTLLAEVREAQGKHNKARVLHESALEIRSALYNGLHESVAESMESIGHMRMQASKYEKARDMYIQARDIRKILTDDAPNAMVAYDLSDICRTYVAQELYHDAKPIAEETLLMRREVYQESLLPIAETMVQLANINSALGEHDNAKNYLEDGTCQLPSTGQINYATHSNKIPPNY
jgi:tetratricopeptide (TPR) repeat protein